MLYATCDQLSPGAADLVAPLRRRRGWQVPTEGIAAGVPLIAVAAGRMVAMTGGTASCEVSAVREY
jgi:hypothetical protein